MKIGDRVIYRWVNNSYYETATGESKHQKVNEAEGKIIALKGKLSALVEFSRGGLRVAQTVRIEKLRLKEEA